MIRESVHHGCVPIKLYMIRTTGHSVLTPGITNKGNKILFKVRRHRNSWNRVSGKVRFLRARRAMYKVSHRKKKNSESGPIP